MTESTGRATAPVHVMHVVSQFAIAGMELGVSKLANSADRSRIRTSVCSSMPSPPQRPTLASDVQLHELNRRPGTDLSLISQLFSLFRRTRPDVVHTHSWGTLCEGLLAAKLAQVPVVIHGEHGTLELRTRNVHVQRWAWQRVSQLLAVSSRLADQMAAVVGEPSQGIHVIRNGVDTERFARVDRVSARNLLQLGPDESVIGTVGRLHPVKDHLNLIHAAANLQRDGLRAVILIVGDGPLRQQLEAEAATLGLTRQVHFLGEREDVEWILQALDVFTLPSRSEGLSNTILEAMAAGVLVVATNVGGAEELIRDGETGVLVPAQDPATLAIALGDLTRDTNLREHMGRRAQALARSEFSLDRMTRGYEELYLGLTQQSPVTRGLPTSAKRFAFATTRYSGMNQVARLALRRRLLVLAYHGVLPDDRPVESYRCRNAVSLQAFRAQLHTLTTLFNPVSLTDVLAWALRMTQA